MARSVLGNAVPGMSRDWEASTVVKIVPRRRTMVASWGLSIGILKWHFSFPRFSFATAREIEGAG
jgi:hypothetical protein